jgi:penicillin-binding protein 2
VKGESLFKKSENNILRKQPIFSDRGLIHDRNDIPLVWNTWDQTDVNRFSFPTRTYYKEEGFSLLLGYTSAPAKDSSGNFWQENFIGKDGVEKAYNTELTGINGEKITQTDVKGVVQSENVVLDSIPGENIKLSIDARIQKKMYDAVKEMAHNSSFTGGAGVIMDVTNGEIISLVNFPEYDSSILSSGQDKKTISGYFSDKRKVFLNRTISGLYAPGSIVKPFIGYAALVENIISPTKLIFANGSISVPNPYFPGKKTIFKDHGVFGSVDMRKAIAISSDVYFYEIGGGFQDQKGLGISKINSYMRFFTIGDKTGIDISTEKQGNIPNPEWKAKTFKGESWYLGDTYNTSIGQYGFQVTPLNMVRSVAILANGGTILTPHVRLGDKEMESKKETIELDPKHLKVIREGMRDVVTDGTGLALNLKSVKVAAKSGTAQVGYGNTNTNSWIIGFFPYEKPRYAFVVMMERGPKEASGNATRVMSQVIDYMECLCS